MQTAMYRKKISNYWAVFRRVSEKPWVLSSDSSEQGEGNYIGGPYVSRYQNSAKILVYFVSSPLRESTNGLLPLPLHST